MPLRTTSYHYLHSIFCYSIHPYIYNIIFLISFYPIDSWLKLYLNIQFSQQSAEREQYGNRHERDRDRDRERDRIDRERDRERERERGKLFPNSNLFDFFFLNFLFLCRFDFVNLFSSFGLWLTFVFEKNVQFKIFSVWLIDVRLLFLMLLSISSKMAHIFVPEIIWSAPEQW